MAVDSTSPGSGSVKANWSPWSDRANLAGILGANKGSRGIPAEQLSHGPPGLGSKSPRAGPGGGNPRESPALLCLQEPQPVLAEKQAFLGAGREDAQSA